VVGEFEGPGSEGHEMNGERRRWLVAANSGVGKFSICNWRRMSKGNHDTQKAAFGFTFLYPEESNLRFTGFIFERFTFDYQLRRYDDNPTTIATARQITTAMAEINRIISKKQSWKPALAPNPALKGITCPGRLRHLQGGWSPASPQ
jgi:hypothetical protein